MSAMHELRSTPITAELFHGALGLESTGSGVVPMRLPTRAAAIADPQLFWALSQPAGVRLAFRTSAEVIELNIHRTSLEFRGVDPRPDCHVDLVIDGELEARTATEGGTSVVIDPATGSVEPHPGPHQVLRFADLPAGEKDVEIWLPHYERVELRELRSDAELQPLPERRPAWVQYGSSIGQGSNATAPTDTWVVGAARSAGLSVANLGFSGSAMLDPYIARVIRDLPAEVIGLEVGINLVNGDVVRRRLFGPLLDGFLDTIREGHPETPILLISPLHCAIFEDTPGPAATDFGDGEIRYRATGDPADINAGAMTLRTVRTDMSALVARRRVSDPNLHLVDGLELFGESDAERFPLADRLHPGPEAHFLIAERFLSHREAVRT
ncbi:SGNH/GDSL hydrolase family protein [Dietzia sp.]|uniref:SGNH/GDSL hydrolase family protein n=1 Tax=Dietzia sp. TaxID=1871616 RepID=UPI002FDB87CD